MSGKQYSLHPFFLDGLKGKLFCLSFLPSDAVNNNRSVLIVPPFAEEMNKSRRMLSLQGRRLAEAGFTVLLPDLYGTGDSEGEFGDASWDCWLDDLNRAWAWFENKEIENISILTLRSGSLLVSDLMARFSPKVNSLVLWQPVVSGAVFLTQFLRLKLAAEMSKSSKDKITVNELKQLLVDGSSIEVAGYMVSPEMASGLEWSMLDIKPGNIVNNIFWYEIVSDESRSLPVVNQKVIESLSASGVALSVSKLKGAPFWLASEIVDVSRLLDLTLTALMSKDS